MPFKIAISTVGPAGGVDPFSPLGLTILSIGIVFTIGLPVLMILKGRSN